MLILEPHIVWQPIPRHGEAGIHHVITMQPEGIVAAGRQLPIAPPGQQGGNPVEIPMPPLPVHPLGMRLHNEAAGRLGMPRPIDALQNVQFVPLDIQAKQIAGRESGTPVQPGTEPVHRNGDQHISRTAVFGQELRQSRILRAGDRGHRCATPRPRLGPRVLPECIPPG